MTDGLKRGGEEVLSSLRLLYGRRGYSHYKMNKFEEYDLYAHNKDFLISDSVITFTDGNGKLLALKPDVTLSIVKNSKDGEEGLEKLYYNENVYRVTKGSRNYKEIMQVGLECIGNVDDYCIYEVLALALSSLGEISPDHILGVSHLGILSEVMDSLGIPDERKGDVLRFIGEKNLHSLSELLDGLGICGERAAVLASLVKLNGNIDECLTALPELIGGLVKKETLEGFLTVIGSLRDKRGLMIDFSVVGDIRYYNGFVFKGYVREIPQSVLSGGQYDMLMRRMGRKSSAVGFAVYLDLIDAYSIGESGFDVDAVVLYDGTSKPDEIGRVVDGLQAEGKRVLVDFAMPEKIRCKEVIVMKNGRVEK